MIRKQKELKKKHIFWFFFVISWIFEVFDSKKALKFSKKNIIRVKLYLCGSNLGFVNF